MITYFDPDTLNTLGVEHPKPVSTGQCAHWIREPGTDNTLNFQMHLGVLGTSFHLYRWRPQDSYREPEAIAHFNPEMDSVIHSFSTTETQAMWTGSMRLQYSVPTMPMLIISRMENLSWTFVLLLTRTLQSTCL